MSGPVDFTFLTDNDERFFVSKVIDAQTEAQKVVIDSQAQATKRAQEGYTYAQERGFDVAEKVAANEGVGQMTNLGVGLGTMAGVGGAVAGMGGLLISEFINRTHWLKNENIHLILQPMTHVEELRKTLFDNGFIIDKEVVAKDGDKLYIILSVYYYEGRTAYTDLDLIVGRLPLNQDDLSKKYLAKIYTKYNKTRSDRFVYGNSVGTDSICFS